MNKFGKFTERNPDTIWIDIKSSGENIKDLTDELRYSLIHNFTSSKLNVLYGYVNQLTKGDKSIRILDYGCGGGTMVTYLRLLGYEDIVGVDIAADVSMQKLNTIHQSMGFNEEIFFSYDGHTLPFDDSSFDLIISQQVLEHVHNVQQYFFECNRILDYNGKILLDFPHRLVPFDTHTRMWLVHYFPVFVRKYFYNKYRDNRAEYYNNLLNLRPLWFYVKLLKKLNFNVRNMTNERMSDFAYRDKYEGNIALRSLVDNLVKIPFLGKYFNKIISLFSNATLIVEKVNDI